MIRFNKGMIILSIIISFLFFTVSVSADPDSDPEQSETEPAEIVTSIEYITSYDVITSYEIIPVTSFEVITSVEVVTSIETVTETVTVTSSEETTTEEIISTEETSSADVTSSDMSDTSPIETVTDDYNYVLSSLLQSLIDQLQDFSDENEIEIEFSDSFDYEVSTFIGSVITSENIDPSVFRDEFIKLVLAQIGIDEDNPFYEGYYELVGSYYDLVTGVAEHEDDDAAMVILFSLAGTATTLGYLKWQNYKN